MIISDMHFTSNKYYDFGIKDGLILSLSHNKGIQKYDWKYENMLSVTSHQLLMANLPFF